MMADIDEERLWYIYHEAGIKGPYALAQMAELYKSGELSATSMISVGDGKWNPAGETKLWELFCDKSFLLKWSVWLLAVIPMLFNFVLSLVFPKSALIPYIYFGLCCIFLVIDILQYRKNQDDSIYRAMIGFLLLPYYLYNRRDNIGNRHYKPLIAWTVLFVFYLSAKSL